MDAQEFRSLQEAYNKVHQLDEISSELAKRAGEERMNRTFALMQKDWKEGRKTPSPEFQASYKKQQDDERRYRKKLKEEQADNYDIIFSHLLDEGYADTNENALVIMANMSEDWMEDIVEAYKELPVGKMRKQIIKHAASGTKRAFLSKFRGQKGTTAGNVEDAKAMKSLNKAKKIQGEIENREKMGSDFYQGSREGRALVNKRRGR